MQPKTIHTIVFSPTGTSRRVADAIVRGFRRSDKDRITEIRSLDVTYAAAEQETFTTEDLVLFAVPVYGGHVAPVALERMKDLQGKGTPAVLLAVYGNRAFEKAVAELASFVTERGFVPVAAGAFVAEHSYSTPATSISAGRPDARDLSQAAVFGGRIRAKLLLEGTAPVDASKLRDVHTPLLPLLRFIRFVLSYRRRQKKHPVVLLPATDEKRCTHCGKCVTLCPVQAIAKGEEQHTDAARCIRCCACVKGCTFHARTFETPFGAALSRNFTHQKPPVTLL